MNEYRYTYHLRGNTTCIYDGDTKIAEISSKGEEAKAIAGNMVRALNARERWLTKKASETVE